MGSQAVLYCKRHAEYGVVDVNSKRCSNASCTKQQSFNFKGNNTAAYCKKPAVDGMVNVRRRRFTYFSRRREPCHDVEGSKAAAYGKQHTDDGMVNANVMRCIRDSCLKRSEGRVLTDGESTACLRHKGDMLGSPVINFSVKCKVVGCKSMSGSGLDGKQPTHCRDHGPLKHRLICTVRRARSKKRGRSPAYGAIRARHFT